MSLSLPICTSEGASSNERAMIQLQLADGIQMDRMMPHFAAAAIRRRYTSSSVRRRWRWMAPPSALYYPLRSLLRWMICRTPFRDATRLRTAAINVCLMNPRSVGRVTVVYHRDDDEDDDDDDDDEDRSRPSSDPRADASRKCYTRSSSERLSGCRVIIDPGYLTDPRDVEALWAGWRASSEIMRRRFGRCTEILPGYFLMTVFALASFASALIDWLVSHSWHGSSFERKESWSRGIGSMSNRPLWFSGFVAEFANPYYHWCGTCAMGEDITEGNDATEQYQSRKTNRDEIASGDRASSFVVDERLCVRGIAGLRICDASVFPACISAPTALTCAALGHIASSFILDADRVIKK
jgi:choline dehydrogenase-like flavoprotein